jgi:hypothetical protein
MSGLRFILVMLPPVLATFVTVMSWRLTRAAARTVTSQRELLDMTFQIVTLLAAHSRDAHPGCPACKQIVETLLPPPMAQA